MPPIVQFLDSLDAMHARASRFVPDCLYSAHVRGATESSIVNLCDVTGGLVYNYAMNLPKPACGHISVFSTYTSCVTHYLRLNVLRCFLNRVSNEGSKNARIVPITVIYFVQSGSVSSLDCFSSARWCYRMEHILSSR